MLKNLFKFEFHDYWRNIDKNILIGFLVLFFLGLFFSFSSTSSLAGERLNKTYYFFFTKHLIFTFLALFIMLFISAIETNLLKKAVIPLFIMFFLLLILVPLAGVEVKGAKRWLDFYLFRLQPIELLKPFFILATVKILTSEQLKSPQLKYLMSFCLLASVIILLVDQPDLGQSILLIGTWIATVFVSGVSFLYIMIFFVIFLILLGSLLFLMPEKFGYVINRLVTFLDPTKGDNFQSTKALDAIKQGGLKGQGMGEGILKDNVPEQHTDYIIAIISEEYGSAVSILIITIFLYIAFRIIKSCIIKNDEFLKLSLCGLASLLIFQTFIHVGVNTSLLPTTGMTLPFLSYGGSSLIGSAVLAGVILNYTKTRLDIDE
jgi:cell division protein FtsW